MRGRIKKEGILLQALVGYFLQKILSDLYSSIKLKLKEYGINHLSNQFVVGWMAEHDSNSGIRSKAASKIISVRVLRHLLQKEKSPEVRLTILRKLTSTDAEAEYKDAHSKKYRKSLLPLLSTQDSLCQAAMGERDRELLELLLPRITDPGKIALFRRHPILDVRNWADKKLWDIGEREETEDDYLKTIMSSQNPDPKSLAQIHNPKF